MKDINDYLPRLPPDSWGVLMNWVPSKVEFDYLIKDSPFPYNSKWHRVQRTQESDDLLIDGKLIRRADDSKLT